ncbi:hypothetical protein LTR97_012111 [Elasticomyces elasticus]|uniref:Uncharacterized protein n=1 Tax=Elasticomyces elasticus TaxID=574655 RepID=A0AAN7ZV80_9PEZI|nr:hypothetical protein LTR97_012111 [Elasticomyces elasticus]
MRFWQLKPRRQLAPSRRHTTLIPLKSITTGGATADDGKTTSLNHTTMMDGGDARIRTGLLQLPAEMRNIIYELVLAVLLPNGRCVTTSYTVPPPSESPGDLASRNCRSGVIPALLQTSRQMRTEAMSIYFGRCLFFFAVHNRGGEFAKTFAWLQSTDPRALSYINRFVILGYVEGVESFDHVGRPCAFEVDLFLPGSYAQLHHWDESLGTKRSNKRVCLARALIDDFAQLRATEVWTQAEHKAHLIAVVKEVHDVLQMSYMEHIESWIGNMVAKMRDSRVAGMMVPNTRTQRIAYVIVSALALIAVCLIAGLVISPQQKPPHATDPEMIGATPSKVEGGLQVRGSHWTA